MVVPVTNEQEMPVGYSTDDLYGDLHSARERLCRAQTYVLKADHRNRIGVAVIQIDLVGSEACPDQWSRYDMPNPSER